MTSDRAPRPAGPTASRSLPVALRRRLEQAGGDAGVIAVITALLAVVLFVFAAIAVDVGRWYSEGQRVQRAVDAAALAGVPYLPGDLPKARTEARKLLRQNGYSAAQAASATITIGDRPSRLLVALSSTIPNAFGTIVGARFKTVTRTAVADFAASVTMGSPCNILGNAPPDTGGGTAVGGTCPRDPNFWNTIAGPDTLKVLGDQFASRKCRDIESNCSGRRNLDYSGGQGLTGQSYYVYSIRARTAVSSMTIQAFDPGFVDVGYHCNVPDKLKVGPVTDSQWDLGPTPLAPDALTRYAWGDKSTTPPAGDDAARFCTGDALTDRPVLAPGASPEEVAAAHVKEAEEAAKLNTSFLVLDPTDTLDPLRATPACRAKSYPGFSGDLTQALVPDSGAYVPQVAQSFRQWVDLCTITAPEQDRDYYLLVRTNVPPGASDSRMLNPAEDASTGGNGLNRFGLRVTSADASISAVERLPIYANLSELPSAFPLARVTSANAGGVLTVTFFDTGDASDPASITISDPDGRTPLGCQADGEVRTSPTGDFNTSTCTLSNVYVHNGYEGKIQRIKVPIPSDYVCDDSAPDDCWYTLTMKFMAGATVADTTTWSASLDGDPVRLVK